MIAQHTYPKTNAVPRLGSRVESGMNLATLINHL
jgi:hypothetical protein